MNASQRFTNTSPARIESMPIQTPGLFTTWAQAEVQVPPGPRPLRGPDALLEQVHAIGSNPIDIMIFKGTFKPILHLDDPATVGDVGLRWVYPFEQIKDALRELGLEHARGKVVVQIR